MSADATMQLMTYLLANRDHWRDRATEERTLVASRDRTIAQLRDVNRTLSEDALAKRSAPPSPAVQGFVLDAATRERIAVMFHEVIYAYSTDRDKQPWNGGNSEKEHEARRWANQVEAALTSAQLVPLASATPWNRTSASLTGAPLYPGLPQPSQAQEGV